MDIGPQSFGIASGLAVVLGIAGVVVPNSMLISTASVVMIVLGVICSLLAVGLFFAEDEDAVGTGSQA